MNIVQIEPADNIIQIDEWQEFLRDGEQFLKVAQAAFEQQKKAFSTETLYNLICMGIEKLVMSFLMSRGDLADNHTMGDLKHAIELHLGPQPELARKMSYMDSFQEICDLDEYNIRTPTREDIKTFLSIAEEIKVTLIPHMPLKEMK